MQPHHLGANAVMLLSAFVTLCEGYLGVRPSLGLWTRLFHFRSQVVISGTMLPNPKGADLPPIPEKVMVECGATTIYTNAKTGYPNPKPLQSVKKWQRTFFYVRTLDNEANYHNLPKFLLDPPFHKVNWGVKIGHSDIDLDNMASRVRQLHEEVLGG